MKLLSLLVLVASIQISTQAFARESRAPQGLCRLSFHSDSAGRGIEAGFKGQDLRPNPVDESCYDQGVEEGQALPQSPTCSSDFENGKQNGISANNLSAGSTCFAKGYIAGFALLGAAARAQDSGTVGSDCVHKYNTGLSDGTKSISQRSFSDSKDSACYMTGFYDASQLEN